MRRMKFAILITCASLVAGLLLFCTRREVHAENAVIWLNVNDGVSFDAIGSEREKRDSDGVLLLNGRRAPYDAASSTYYVPQSLSDNGFTGRLTWSKQGVSAYLAADGFDKDSIADGRAYALTVSDGRRSFSEKVVFTGLPALVLDIEQTVSYVFDKGLPAGTIDLFVPGKASLSVQSCYATCRVRGNLSGKLPKVPYRLTLFDRDGKRLPFPLLGMPKSDEWILNAMYSEPSRVRDKLALDTWNGIAAERPSVDPRTASMEYVELFYDNAYLGVYGLMNPVNESLLALNEGDVLFKASEWETPSAADLREVSDTLDGGSAGVSIKWPKTFTSPALWSPMIRYVETFYDRRGSVPPDEGLRLMSCDNLVDYALFFLVVTPRDNYFSNTYYLVRTESDGVERITKIPWDLNCTFGNCVTATTRTHCKQRYEISAEVLFPDDVETLLNQGVPDLQQALCRRYYELRKTVFSEEAMLSRLYAQAALLSDSGATAREMARWPEGGQQPDVTPIADFINEHLRVLDEYFAGVAGKESNLGIPS